MIKIDYVAGYSFWRLKIRFLLEEQVWNNLIFRMQYYQVFHYKCCDIYYEIYAYNIHDKILK